MDLDRDVDLGKKVPWVEILSGLCNCGMGTPYTVTVLYAGEKLIPPAKLSAKQGKSNEDRSS